MGANDHLPDDFMRTGSKTLDVREGEKEKHDEELQRIRRCGKPWEVGESQNRPRPVEKPVPNRRRLIDIKKRMLYNIATDEEES